MVRKYILASLAVMLALSATPALADKGKGHGPKESGHHSSYDNDKAIIVIGPEDRTYLRDHISRDYRRDCPPGLAKKHNGCLPPGQAKKHYEIGRPLPRDVVFVPVSVDVRRHLSPLPAGYTYVQVDKDVLLINEATKKVIDAVTLLSAVGN